MDSTSYIAYLADLRKILGNDPQVLGLLTVGSTADHSYRDGWSDHDFWIITENGCQERYRSSVSWLPHAESILLSAAHDPAYRSVLYRNKHKVEYAVFEAAEAHKGRLERFRVLFDRADIGGLARQIAARSVAERGDARARQSSIENLALLVWTGYGLATRGEFLAAHRYLTGFAVDLLLDLLAAQELIGAQPTADLLDPRRRLEQLEPTIAADLRRIVGVPLTEAGRELIALAERSLRSHRPEWLWDEVAVVKGWLL